MMWDGKVSQRQEQLDKGYTRQAMAHQRDWAVRAVGEAQNEPCGTFLATVLTTSTSYNPNLCCTWVRTSAESTTNLYQW